MKLIPLSDLSKNGDDWISTGNDPHFLVDLGLNNGDNLSGWLIIELYIEFIENARKPQLFWDEGSGFSENKSIYFPFPINGISRKIIHFPNAIVGFRIDPTDCPAKFKKFDLKIQPTSFFAAIIDSLKPYFIKAARNPKAYLKFTFDLFRLLCLSGLSAVNQVFKEFLVGGSGSQARQYLTTQLTFAKYRSQQASGNINVNGQARFSYSKNSKKIRILIGLVEHFGDIIACEPVVRDLHKEYPDAEISWVVQSKFRELVDSHPLIDQIVSVDCLTDWIKIRSHANVDKVIDLHVNGRICQCCRVPLHKFSGDLTITGDNHFAHGNLLEALSKGAGLNISNVKPRLYISEAIKSDVDEFRLPKKFIAIHAKSNHDAKDWNPHYWKKLAQQLIASGYDIVEIGLASVIHDVGAGYHDLCGKTTLLQLAEIIRRSVLFIGVESGPGHVANALEIPAVIIIGQLQSFKNYDPYSGPHKNIRFARNINGSAAALNYEIVSATVLETLSTLSGELIFENSGIGSEMLTAEMKDTKEKGDVKLIAFYLPQFHPIPENDKAWGKGFTEWTNVGKAKPFFDQQYQPRLPGELGYYDLRLSTVLEQQAELAQSYGLYGFCYYYYWFNGRRLLNKPIDKMLLNQKVSMPFCFCWANENWTRRWDGMSKEIIVPQHHSLEDDRAFIRNLFSAFSDERYIRINGKPLLLIYRTDLFPNPKLTTELWRSEVKKAGFDDLYLVRCESNDAFTDPRSIGFDASYEVPTFILPDDLRYEDLGSLNISGDFKGRIYDYSKIVDYYCNRPEVPYKRFRDPMLAWDNTPRHKENAVIYHGVTPELYEKWIGDCVADARKKYQGDERIVFINAWNEWAEGSYLEPDGVYGRAFLEATLRAINVDVKHE